MKMVMAIFKPFKLDDVRDALTGARHPGLDGQRGQGIRPPEGPDRNLSRRRICGQFLPKVKIEVVVDDGLVERAVETIRKAAGTDKIGDGKIFVYGIEQAIRIRTGESGIDAL